MSVELIRYIPYIFLTCFLAVFFGIIIFSIVRYKFTTNKNCPSYKKIKDVPFYEKIISMVIVLTLPVGVVFAILFKNITVTFVCFGVFAITVIVFLIFSSLTKVSIKTVVYGNNTTIFCSIKEFEERISNGTLDLTNCKVRYPKGYNPPKSLFLNDTIDDDPFSTYNDDDFFSKYD